MNSLLTLDDIAAALKLPHNYVRDRLVKRPDFPRPCVQISQKNKRWNLADLTAWQEKHQQANAR
jgi:hypothetical protein